MAKLFETFDSCNTVLKAFDSLKVQNSITLYITFGDRIAIVKDIPKSFYHYYVITLKF